MGDIERDMIQSGGYMEGYDTERGYIEGNDTEGGYKQACDTKREGGIGI